MNELALFAGAGGGILAGKILGWRTVCAVEHNAYCAAILAQRQNDGILEPFPIWPDVRSFDAKPWKGIVDVVSGGFPCQDISAAGKGAGIEGKRSGLWSEMFRIVREIRPKFVFVENSPMLTRRGIGRVLGDLASIRYDAKWDVFGAHHFGAPHKRDRIWILANADGERCGKKGKFRHSQFEERIAGGCKKVANTDVINGDGSGYGTGKISQFEPSRIFNYSGWESEPGLGRVANGMANRLGRSKAIGNGQVPIVAANAFRLLSGRREGLR